MMPRFVLMLIAALMATSALYANNFRGMPYYAKVTSVNFKPASSVAENRVDVCYQFATTTPLFDYSDLASSALSGAPVTLMPQPPYDERGIGQDVGIEFRFGVFGFTLYAYVQSEPLPFDIAQIDFFNSAVRNVAGTAKPLRQISFATNFRAMIFPQYEWVNVCETIPFGRAYSEDYVKNLFKGSGPIAHVRGSAAFSFNLFPPSFLGMQPIKLSLNGADYAVPVFGLAPLKAGDMRMISLSHFVNSLNAMRANVDEKLLNDFLEQNRGLIAQFEEQYRIKIQLPLSVEGIVGLFHRVADIENPHDGE